MINKVSISLTNDEALTLEADAKEHGVTPSEAAAILLKGRLVRRSLLLRLLAWDIPRLQGAMQGGKACRVVKCDMSQTAT